MLRALKLIGPAVTGVTLALSVVLPSGSQGAAGDAKGSLTHKDAALVKEFKAAR